MQRVQLRTGVLLFALTASGCAFSTTAKDWNGLMGLDGEPTYYTSTMKVGLNLLVVVPFIGDMGISGLTRDLTEDIKAAGGNEVRIVQGSTESYFYGFPPFTWLVTPVVSTVAAEYAPNAETFAKDQEAIAAEGPPTWSGKWYKPWTW